MNTLERIKEEGVVAVIRQASVDNIYKVAEALEKGGITGLEITVESPGAVDAIKALSKEYGNRFNIGAGTVLDPETARVAIMAGADYIVTPTLHIETISMTKRYGKLMISGAFTPTEILTAYETGADVVKVFPARAVGPKYISDIHGPLPHIPLIPTGGIDLSNAAAFIKAGALAIGLGGSLVDLKKELTEAYLETVSETATEFLSQVKNK